MPLDVNDNGIRKHKAGIYGLDVENDESHELESEDEGRESKKLARYDKAFKSKFQPATYKRQKLSDNTEAILKMQRAT